MKIIMSGKDNCDATLSGMQLVSKKTFEWRIDEFNRISKNPSDINAQTIKFDVDSCSELPAMTWTLSLSHRFSSPDGRVHVDLNYLCDTKGGLRQIPMYVATVSLFGESLSSNLGRTASGYLELMKAKAWTRKGGVKAYDWTGALVRGVLLAFEFTLEFYIDRDTIGMRSAVESWNKLNEHSSKAHFLEMLKSGHLSDITIVGKDGQAFKAHKLIINAGSEVFEAMFRHEMTESTTGVTVITLGDMSATAVKFLLHFLYSFEVLPISANEDDPIDEVVMTLAEVFYLASKYGFNGLVKHLENNIQNGNVVYLLRMCKLYSLNNGVKKIFDLAKKNQWNALDEFMVSQQ